MSDPVVACRPDDPVDTAVKMMRDAHLGALPVGEGTQPVGIITETDLLRQIVRADADDTDIECIAVSYS